jgi:hypothetical protein
VRAVADTVGVGGSSGDAASSNVVGSTSGVAGSSSPQAAAISGANVVLAALNGNSDNAEEVYWKDVYGKWSDRHTWWSRFYDPTTRAWSEWRIWKDVPACPRFQ